MLRSLILAAAGNPAVRRVVAGAPISRDVVARFVAGETTAEALAVARELVEAGLAVTLAHVGEHSAAVADVEAGVAAYLRLLDALYDAGLARRVEVSVKLSAVGQQVGEAAGMRGATRICAAAEQAGTTVTLDAEDHTTTDPTLRVLDELRRTWPWVGVVLQSYLRRSEEDCGGLSTAESRVRLCKGAYAEPEDVAYQDVREVDRSYVRCANVLLAGSGYPMFATHDPRLVEIVGERARQLGRKLGSYEYQMLYGVRPEEQRRLAGLGETVRVYVPYGTDWYGYLVRRLAERPANTLFLLRAVGSRR